MLILGIISVYLISIIAFYKLTQYEHGPSGRFNNIEPTIADIVLMITPIVNTTGVCWMLLANLKISPTKFFNVKNKLK